MMSVFKSNIFKGFLFVVFMIYDGMSGVLQNSGGSSITILDYEEFKNLSDSALKNIFNITFENQTLDDDFCDHWYDLDLDKVSELNFQNCDFSEDSFAMFRGYPVTKLTINNSIIATDDVDGKMQLKKYIFDKSKNVTNINFEKQAVDHNFYTHWSRLGLDEKLDKLVFNDCSFVKEGFYVFNNLSAKNLKITNCGICAADVDKILEVDPYVIESIDLSDNNLVQDEKKLEEVFLDKLTKTRFVMNLILKDNNLSSNFKSLITENKNYDSGVNFIF